MGHDPHRISRRQCTVDGELIYTIKGARTGMFPGIAYPDYPHQSARSVGGMVRPG